MPKRKNWDIDQLRYWVEVENRNLRWIGRTVGCDKQTAWNVCKENGIVFQRCKDWPIEKIRMWKEVEGKTDSWIAEQIGCAHGHVSRICKKHGIRTHRTGPRSGPGHPEWKGGTIVDKDGYILEYCPGHPYARNSGYVLQHRLVMEQHLGRYLEPNEVVHHKTPNKQDNLIENLELFSKNSEHLKHELTGKCPNWTPEGRARSLAGVQRWRDNRKALKLCALQTPQTNHQTPAQPCT